MAGGLYFTATVMTVPWQYTILGIVVSTKSALGGKEHLRDCLGEIQQQALRMGAKGIIGVQVAYGTEPETRVMQRMVTTVTGTAITWTDPVQQPVAQPIPQPTP